MTNRSHTATGDEGQSLPDCPGLALFVADLFHKLGGQLSIDNGHRYVWSPEPGYFQLEGEELPQLHGAKPWEQFHSTDEWRGALKVAGYWLTRLSDADKNFVFTLLAPVCARPNEGFDFREHLQ